jgi:DNA polymerase-4
VGATRKVRSESRERTFERDLDDPAQLRVTLRKMSAELCASLSSHGRRGRSIAIKVRLDDFTTVTRTHTVPEPTSDPMLVGDVALRLLAEYAPQRPVRLLGVRVAGLNSAEAPIGNPDPPGGGVSTHARPGAPDQLELSL